MKHNQAEWPLVKCTHCPTVAKWKKMRSVKVWEFWQETLKDKEDAWVWVYTCVECVAKELKCTNQQAIAHIAGDLATPKWARERNMKFKAAYQDRRTQFPGMSHRGVRNLARDDLAQVLAPLAEFVARKLVQLKARQQGIEEYDQLLVELRNVKDKDMELAIIGELERWDQELEKLTTPIAFEGKEDAVEMMNVAQYHDEWVNTKSGALRAWYVCLQDWGESYPPCGTVMPSKQWKRKFEEVGATKQKWYCVCCTTRFRTAYGMLVEVRAKGISTFMLAEVTDKDVEDIRAMYLEQKLRPKDHMDLWRMIPDFKPIDPKDILRPVRPQEIAKQAIGEGFDISTVSKFVDVQGLKELPKWDWDQIFTLLDGASSL